MISVKDKAILKMLEEMNEEHSSAEDAIHNYLCDQQDEKLFEGILKEDRSIKGAVKYCMSKAKNQAVNNAAMVSDNEVFEWVVEYFKLDKVKQNKDVKGEVVVQKVEKKPKKSKPIKPNQGEQLSLFEL